MENFVSRPKLQRFKELEHLLYEERLKGLGLVAWGREGSGGILGGWTLEEVSQIYCEVSNLGDIKQTTRHSLGQPALSDPALSKGLGLDDLQPKWLYV